jgi:hypothetical protein
MLNSYTGTYKRKLKSTSETEAGRRELTLLYVAEYTRFEEGSAMIA